MTYKRKETIGDCELYLGDCLEVMPMLGKVDAVVTDPPYGINQDKGFGGFGGFGKPIERNQYQGDWDSFSPNKDLFDLILNISNVAIIWGGNYFTDKLPQNNSWLVWDKENTMPTFSDCELAWTNIKRNNVKRIKAIQNGCMTKEKGERYHPTQKQISVMRFCLEQIPDSKTILDPFMGSGTTGVACVKLGRKFIGVELDEKYFDIACKRIEEAYKQPDMFVEQVKQVAHQESMEL